MRMMCARLAAFGAALVLLAPAAARGQEGIYVSDFARDPSLGPIAFSLTSTGQVREVTTSTVIITKNLVDLVPDQLINATGGTIVGNAISHFQDRLGIGSISMKVIPSGGPGSVVTLNVGLSDHFKFNVVREGLISNVSFNPNPTTVPAGGNIVVTVTGAGLSGATVHVSACHSVTPGTATNTTIGATLKTQTGCSTAGTFQLNLVPPANDPLAPKNYAMSTAKAFFTFGPYLPTVACTSSPGIVAPTISSPANGQTIKFTSGGSTTQAVSFAWQNGIVPAPNNQFVVEVASNISRGGTGTTFVSNVALSNDTVKALGTSKSLHVPGTYTLTVKPLNCGSQPQPAVSSRFTLSF